MTAERLETLRFTIADMYWEVVNNHDRMTREDAKIAGDLRDTLYLAGWQLTDLRDHARQREDETR
jgi:hypothetical protein